MRSRRHGHHPGLLLPAGRRCQPFAGAPGGVLCVHAQQQLSYLAAHLALRRCAAAGATRHGLVFVLPCGSQTQTRALRRFQPRPPSGAAILGATALQATGRACGQPAFCGGAWLEATQGAHLIESKRAGHPHARDARRWWQQCVRPPARPPNPRPIYHGTAIRSTYSILIARSPKGCTYYQHESTRNAPAACRFLVAHVIAKMKSRKKARAGMQGGASIN